MNALSNIMVGLLLAGAALGAAAQSEIVSTDHVTARLLAYAPQGVGAGKPLQLGLQLEHKDGWHTYWKNPGDSGLPVSLAWTLPAGATAGDIAWPVPKRLPFGPLMNYGYDGTVLLPVPVTMASAGGDLQVKLHAEWLVCKEICLPESGQFAMRLPGGGPLVAHRAAFEAAAAAAPRPVAGASADARVDGDAVAVQVTGLPAALRGKQVLFFPEDAGVFEHAKATEQRWEGDRLVLRAPLAAMRSESPSQLRAVLAQQGAAGGIALTAPVTGWPAPGGAAPATAAAADGAGRVPGAGSAAGANGAPGAGAAAGVDGTLGAGGAAGLAGQGAGDAAVPAGLAVMLLFAFLGGALLNLMPCVFPVLSLKAVSLAQRSGGRGEMLAGGIAYTVGVLASFLALAGVLLALRAGGSLIGWGFQLQSPQFVAGLAVLFTLIGLNLMGVFEVGTMLPGSIAAYRAKNPLLDDALTGAVAVAIASPCTAPLMGAAVGAALTAPWPVALAIFGALGLGMAAPYLALTAWPRLAHAIPRPGPWMVRFKALLAFPMFATVIWLAWVLGQQAGVDGMAALLVLLLAASLVVWLWAGKPAGTGHAAAGRAAIGQAATGLAGLAVLAAALAWALPQLQPMPVAMAAAGATTNAAPAGQGAAGQWQAWSPQAVEAARQANRPVFVDFTAAWCITCQFNKRTTLSDPQVLEALAAKQVVLLRADWTNRDPVIARQLQELGRSGVPVYALYSARDPAPTLLPELLTVETVRSALSRL